MILRKPAYWSPGPAFCDPRFSDLWRDAIVYPLWEGTGTTVITLPNHIANTGGNFPSWTGRNYLSFNSATPDYITFDIEELGIGRDLTDPVPSIRADHSIGAVFRTTTSAAATIYGEGDTADNDEFTSLQVRGDQSGLIRFFYRTGDQSGVIIRFRSNDGQDYADGEWHGVACASGDVRGGSGGTCPAGTLGYGDGRVLGGHDCSNLPSASAGSNSDTCHIGRILRAGAGTEPFDGDISLVVTWRRSLSRHEARLFSLDPFGMLRPVLRVAGRPWTPPIQTLEEVLEQIGIPWAIDAKDPGWEDELANTSDAELLNSVDVKGATSTYIVGPS